MRSGIGECMWTDMRRKSKTGETRDSELGVKGAEGGGEDLQTRRPFRPDVLYRYFAFVTSRIW
jgi:hypothetical protein